MSDPDMVPSGPAERLQQRKALQAGQARQDRLDEVQRLRDTMPQAMQALPQWLLWRRVQRPGRPKPLKMPCYARTGHPRGWPKGRPEDGKPTERQPQVPQGHEADRAELVTLEAACEAYVRSPRWAGIGFAFLPGDGLIGVDIDHAVDAQGQPSDLCRQVVELCASYTELSPSGSGVHIIVQGSTETFKDDTLGLEVYCNAQYFACTGRAPAGEAWPATPGDVVPVDPLVVQYMRELVDESRKRQAAAKAAAAAPAPAALPAAAPVEAAPAAPARAPAVAAAAPGTVLAGGDDFKRVNEAAMAALHKWVPRLFPEPREWRNGYRITSKALGRDLQEDLAIQADGIVDWGVADLGDARQGKRSPVDLVMEWGAGVGVPAGKPGEALRWLAQQLGIALSPPARRAPVPAPRPAASPGRQARPGAPQQGVGDGQAEGSAPHDAAPMSPAEDAGDEGDAAAGGGGGGGGGKKLDPKVWALVEEMVERFALVYGTDTAYDRWKMRPITIAAMRLAFGRVPVQLWLSRDYRAMIDPEDLVFEPGDEVPAPKINMWGGLELQPIPCEKIDVDPMLRLLQHLCSETRILDADGKPVPTAVDDVMHWILCWMAIPLQQPGTKMATALVMHGAQGTGKNLFFDAWRDLYGIYGITVTQTELEDKYNGWASRKLAAVGDEVVSRAEMYHNKNRLKLIVTQRDKFAIRDLYATVRWESNHMNVVFTSNENEPLVLEDRDRRYLVVYTPLEAPAELYQQVRDFLADDGLGKWLDFLLQYDVGDFTAHTKPLLTEAKRALIEANWRSSARFVHDWLNGYLDLPLQVCSVEQLYRAFRRWCDQTGERWPPSQPKFTAEVNRWVSESRVRGKDGKFPAPRLDYRVIALAAAGAARKATRCFVPAGCGPNPGVGEGVWAADCVASFEQTLWKFLGRRQLLEGEES